MARSAEDIDAVIFPGGVPSRTVVDKRKAAVLKAEAEQHVGWDANPIRKSFRGEEMEFFPIAALAAALGRKAVTIRLWERQGRMPMSRYRTPAPNQSYIPGKEPQGRRMYTRAQVEAVIKAAKASGVTDPDGSKGVDWIKFRDMIVAAWNQS